MFVILDFLIIFRYMRIFWEQFYQPRSDGSTDEPEVETEKWAEISKKLTYKNQLDIYEFHHQTMSNDEVKKKASAWFHVTYDPWMKYMNKNSRSTMRNPNMAANGHETEKQQRFKGLFSFAWLVYPVLLKIFDEKENNSKNDTELKQKKKKKRKNKKKNSPVPANNNNG
jgi:hypothetical protein